MMYPICTYSSKYSCVHMHGHCKFHTIAKYIVLKVFCSTISSLSQSATVIGQVSVLIMSLIATYIKTFCTTKMLLYEEQKMITSA